MQTQKTKTQIYFFGKKPLKIWNIIADVMCQKKTWK